MNSVPDRSAGQASHSRRATGYLKPVLTGRRLLKYRLAVLIWAALALFFWQWWLQPGNNLHTGRYLLVSAGIFWIFFLQIYFLLIFLNAHKSDASITDLGPFRAAMVVTKTPSEPFSVVRRTLVAMLAQDIAHDTWLADEDPSPETLAWCLAHGVNVSSRKGVAAYHRPDWPRRTRCKEGNLAYFYDQYGFERYDFVSQLDADHVPSPSYLRELLKPFADPGVGYVSAPSICSSNAEQSWAARTRLYAEAMFHGVLQAGYSGGWAPMCIGSHYAVRTAALKEVGGLGPELAEDHSTSMILNAGGWRGVHAIDAIAHGDGPGSIADMVTQEFQWSRSLFTLLLRYTPHYFRALPARLRFQFVFSQVWYPLFACFMALMFMMPILALVFDVRFADVTFPGFVGHVAPSIIALIIIAYLIRHDGLFRPYDAKILSWEKALFAGAQWPWVLFGCLTALRDRLTGTFVDFRITPKGEAVHSALPLRVIVPYTALAMASLLPVLLISKATVSAGFYILAMINALLYISLLLVIIVHHARETGVFLRLAPLSGSLQLATAAALIVLAVAAGLQRGTHGVHAMAIGLEPMIVSETQFVVSGAGQAPPGSVRYVFKSGWQWPGTTFGLTKGGLK